MLKVLDNCNNAIYSQNVGPFTTGTNLGIIYVTPSANGIITIKGKLLTCSVTNVVNGYAIIILNNWVHYAAADANGNFSTNYAICSSSSASVQITGVDATAQQQGNPATYTVTPPVTNVGNVSACGNSTTQYYQLHIGWQ